MNSEVIESAVQQIESLTRKLTRMEQELQHIHDIAQDNYDGPEDHKWGAVLSSCQWALGIVP